PLTPSPPAPSVTVGLTPFTLIVPPPCSVAPSNVFDETVPKMLSVFPDATLNVPPVCVLLRTLKSTVPLCTSSVPLLLKSGLNGPPPIRSEPAPPDLRNVPRLLNVPCPAVALVSVPSPCASKVCPA